MFCFYVPMPMRRFPSGQYPRDAWKGLPPRDPRVMLMDQRFMVSNRELLIRLHQRLR